MIERMAGREQISANALAQEVGVSQSSLSRWLRMRPSRKVAQMTKDERRGAKTRTMIEKLRIVLEASELGDEELGAFLRREGLHEAQLKEWTEAATTALSSKSKSKRKAEATAEAKRIRELEKNLRRKDKALAEVTALLVLKKKAEEIWGVADDDTDTVSGT
jgi:hypothetical protein